MKLPQNSLIDSNKLKNYLLLPKKRNDKSKWLLKAGYTLANWQILEKDIRSQLLTLPATLLDETPFGQMYQINGKVKGPNGKSLFVCSIWMQDINTSDTKLITMYPDKGRSK